MKKGKESLREKDVREERLPEQGIGNNVCGSPTYPLSWQTNHPGWGFFTGSPATQTKYNVPMQGKADTCGLIAALSAIAWVKPALIQAQSPTAFSFYDPNGILPGTPFNVTLTLATDTNHYPIFARCDQAYSSTFNLVWPGIYELAWAKWLLKKTGSPDQIDISTTSPKNPLYALQAVTKTTTPNTQSGASTNYANIPVDATGKTTKCTAAWTYSDRDAIYTSTGLYPSHAYTVLGRFTYSANNYIVLRNPCGNRCHGMSEPTSNVTTVGPTGPVWNGISLSNQNDGVFAILASAFGTYFWMWGLVL